jgi:hypothetical protein
VLAEERHPLVIGLCQGDAGAEAGGPEARRSDAGPEECPAGERHA